MTPPPSGRGLSGLVPKSPVEKGGIAKSGQLGYLVDGNAGMTQQLHGPSQPQLLDALLDGHAVVGPHDPGQIIG